jgi:hypothetical protein
MGHHLAGHESLNEPGPAFHAFPKLIIAPESCAAESQHRRFDSAT